MRPLDPPPATRARARWAPPLADRLRGTASPSSHRCAACDEALGTPGAPFCPDCASSLLPVRGGDPTAAAAFVYVGAVARAVGRLRGGRGAHVARPLGELLGRALQPQARALSGSVVVPVPLHPARLAERGYNQAGLLAHGVARRLGAPLWPGALARTRDTPRQATLPRAARLESVFGAFVAREPEHVAGQRVLLVDDVWTSGATLEACSRALLEAGATSVFRAALARAGY